MLRNILFLLGWIQLGMGQVVLASALVNGRQDLAQKPVQFPMGDRLDGPETRYTRFLIDIASTWPKGQGRFLPAPPLEGNPLKLQCLETPGNPDYIGVQQRMLVQAPLRQVEAVLDDFNHYRDLFPGYDDIHVISRTGNKVVTYWEQHIPLFFVPNVKYEMTYLVDQPSSDRKVYRYQLKESRHLKASDGLIIIEKDKTIAGMEMTHYYEYDFYDADWGILKTIAPSRIWKENVEGIYLSDVAIKLKAEHPDWTFQRVVEESRKLLQIFPIERVLENKTLFNAQ